MGNVTSIWSKREEDPKTANGETSSATDFEKTEKANGDQAASKKRRKAKKNKKLTTGVASSPNNNVKDTEVAYSEDPIVVNVETLNNNEFKTVSEEVEKTGKDNAGASRKKKRKMKKNKNMKLASGENLNAHNDVEDTEIAKYGQQDTNILSDVPYQVIDGQRIDTDIDVKTASEEVQMTEKANSKASRKNKKKKKKNKKLATSVILSPCNNVEDTEIAEYDQQNTNVQCKVNDGQLIAKNVETLNSKDIANRSKKMLLVLDVNGLLVEVIHPAPKDCKPDTKILRRAIFKRPFLEDFLEFCFERFDVAIWSSRTRKILDPVVDYLFGDLKNKLVFLWDSSYCTNTSTRSLENRHKFIVFKKLGKIWEEIGLIAPENGYYDESNTLLLDDSPYKALLNPKHTGIFPLSYQHMDINDNSLGPDGDLRIYLEGVAASENVKTYVEQHPFGQRAIDETSPHWGFYSRVLEIAL